MALRALCRKGKRSEARDRRRPDLRKRTDPRILSAALFTLYDWHAGTMGFGGGGKTLSGICRYTLC